MATAIQVLKGILRVSLKIILNKLKMRLILYFLKEFKREGVRMVINLLIKV